MGEKTCPRNSQDWVSRRGRRARGEDVIKRSRGDRPVALSFGGLIFSFEAFCSKIGEAGSDLFEMLIVVEQ